MSALLDVPLRTAKTADQEVPQALLGPGEIHWIHRAKNLVGRDLAVKSGDETMESVLSDDGIDLVVFHDSMLTRGRRPSASGAAMVVRCPRTYGVLEGLGTSTPNNSHVTHANSLCRNASKEQTA
jgi:hypothetical protein